MTDPSIGRSAPRRRPPADRGPRCRGSRTGRRSRGRGRCRGRSSRGPRRRGRHRRAGRRGTAARAAGRSSRRRRGRSCRWSPAAARAGRGSGAVVEGGWEPLVAEGEVDLHVAPVVGGCGVGVGRLRAATAGRCRYSRARLRRFVAGLVAAGTEGHCQGDGGQRGDDEDADLVPGGRASPSGACAGLLFVVNLVLADRQLLPAHVQ